MKRIIIPLETGTPGLSIWMFDKLVLLEACAGPPGHSSQAQST